MTAKRKRYSIAVIGLGRMGKNHERVLRAHGGFDVVAVVDPNEDLSDAMGKGSKAFASIREFAASGMKLDFAIIATPNRNHLPSSHELAALKVPFLVEKPLAPTFEESQKIVSLAKQAGVDIFVGHTERSNPAVKKLREVIDSGVLGTPIHFSATRVGGFPNEREGTNVLFDLAVHDLDVLTTFMGPLKLRSSICHNTYDHDYPDTAQLLLTSESGASAAVHVNWITPTKIRTLRVTGTLGVARVDYILQTCRVVGGNLIKRSPRFDFSFKEVVDDYKNVDQIEFGVDREEPLLSQAHQIFEFLNVGQTQLCRVEQASQIVSLAEVAMTMGTGGIRGGSQK